MADSLDMATTSVESLIVRAICRLYIIAASNDDKDVVDTAHAADLRALNAGQSAEIHTSDNASFSEGTRVALN